VEKEKIILPIGNNKALIFEADSNSKEDLDFAKLCTEVAATKPQTIQEFFVRLNDLQQQQLPETGRKISRKL